MSLPPSHAPEIAHELASVDEVVLMRKTSSFRLDTDTCIYALKQNERVLNRLRLAAREGVWSAFGTMPGISLHNELRILTDLGLNPRQALAAATSNPAEVFRWRNTGQMKTGYDADVLVVDADPTADTRNLKRICMIIRDGQIIDRDALLNSR